MASKGWESVCRRRNDTAGMVPDGKCGDKGVDLEMMARTLQESGDYHVLRRLVPRHRIEEADGQPLWQGLCVDVETTGLDAAHDEIIELAMTPFSFGEDGRIYEVGASFQGLREPAQPIPAQVTALTGIDDAMVAGQSIDPVEVDAFIAPADLVIAHNAAFDRRFLERFCPAFVAKPWACSMSEIDWIEEGHEGRKLVWLAAGAGFFYDRHRAVHDCVAVIELLARPLPTSGVRAMARLLERARAPTWRIWAEGAPFDRKDQLKTRGYHWNPGGIGGPKAWYIDVVEAQRDNEMAFLQTEIYQREVKPPARRIDAHDRFSDRCWP
jgi:DNA polymerase III subunit epsilon